MFKTLKERIVERENGLVTDLKKMRNAAAHTSAPLYIYGTALAGAAVAGLLDANDIKYDGFVSSKKYYKPAPNVFCLEELMSNIRVKADLIVAHAYFQE